MKVEIKVKKEVEIKTLEINAKVRYFEDATINGVEDTDGNLTPCVSGEYWKPIIDIESGKILNWKIGTVADIHFKVCDCGVYTLKDENNNEVLSINGYVPNIACPERNGYGDYIIMNIDKDGQIANWNNNIDDFLDIEEY